MPPTRRDRRRARQHAGVFRLLAIVFFGVPIALWAVGVHSNTGDKRALAPFPSSLTSWDVMDETAAYVNDHVPFRGTAIRLRADISQGVFGEAPPGQGAIRDDVPTRKPPTRANREFVDLPEVPPEPEIAGSADVMVGTDGWLYLNREFLSECEVTDEQRQAVIAGYGRLQQILATSGRQMLFTIAPDKSTSEPEHLPTDNPFAECSTASKRATFTALRDAAIPGYIDMRRIIEQREKAEDRAYYFRKDTHWNGLATAALAETMVKAIDPTLLETTTIKEGVQDYEGDLTTFLGTPTVDKGLITEVVRPGVTVTANRDNALADGATLELHTATTTSAPLYDGSAVVIGDSFAGSSLLQLDPFFPTLRWIHSVTVSDAPLTTVEKISEAKVVILISIERDLRRGVLWTDAFLDKLEEVLPAYQP